MSLEFLSPAIRLLDATVGALRGANFEVHFITVMKLLRMGLTSSHSLSKPLLSSLHMLSICVLVPRENYDNSMCVLYSGSYYTSTALAQHCSCIAALLIRTELRVHEQSHET